jgi:hypothetical protein
MNTSARGTAPRPRRFAPLLLAALAAAMLSSGAQAAFTFCTTDRGTPSGFGYCADAFTTAGGNGVTGTTTIGSPDGTGIVPVIATEGSGGAGAGSLASATAGPGALHGIATAFADAAPPPDNFSFASAFGHADARLFETGVITDPTGTLAIGTPGVLHLNMLVEGAFAGDGEATTTLLFQDGNTLLLDDRPNIADVFNGGFSLIPITLNVAVGDDISFFYTLTVQTGATNQGVGHGIGLADASDTATLTLDLDGGLLFTSASGFDYRANAAVNPTDPNGPPSGVPEPATPALAALGAMAWVARRRRTAVRSSAA